MNFATNFLPSKPCSKGRAELEPGHRGDRGWALVSVLWTLSMLALMAAATEALTVTSYRIEQHAMVEARAQSALDAAIVRAVLGIADTRPQERWRVDGAGQTFVFESAALNISVQDELGRIDLNTASSSLIRQLLLATGLSLDQANALSDRIFDWRSTSGLKSLNGGTDADYQAARLAYGPRHGPFQTVDELKLVLGMTPQLFAKLRPALTVYSRRAMFDPNVAPREALQALYPNDPQKIDQILRAREGDPNAVLHLGYRPGVIDSQIPLGGRAFSISAGFTIGRRTFKRYAVVELTGDDKRPYFVLAWQ